LSVAATTARPLCDCGAGRLPDTFEEGAACRIKSIGRAIARALTLDERLDLQSRLTATSLTRWALKMGPGYSCRINKDFKRATLCQMAVSQFGYCSTSWTRLCTGDGDELISAMLGVAVALLIKRLGRRSNQSVPAG
jgi:hypothetical protein